MRVFIEVDWSQSTELAFRVEDGTKGDKYEATASYRPDDGSKGLETGWSAQKLGDRDKDGDGETSFGEAGPALVPTWASRPGTLFCWIRPEGSGQTDGAVVGPSGPYFDAVRVP